MKFTTLLEPLVVMKQSLQDTFRAPTSKIWGERFERAVKNDWPAVIRKAVSAGISPERSHSVDSAVGYGSTGALQALIALGVNINADKDSAYCPLRRAARNGNEKMVEILLTAKADPNSIYDDESPLLKAIGNGYTPIVRQLLNAGADINYAYTRYGHQRQTNEMAVAKRHGYADIERILTEEQQKRAAAPSPAPAPQAQQTPPPSAVPALVAEIEKLSDEDRASLFSSLGRKFSDDFANAGKIKVLKPLQYTRKPEAQKQDGPA